jgi:hypothetical protein
MGYSMQGALIEREDNMAQERHETNRRSRAHRNGEKTAEQTRAVAETMSRVAQQRIEQGTRELAAMSERALEAWMRSSNDVLSRVLEVNRELTDWSREQLDDTVHAVRSIAQCRTVGDAYGVQVELMRTSMEKSLRHASSVLDLTTRAMIGGMRRAEQAGSEAAAQAAD